MTEAEMQEQIQAAQDMIDTLQVQRNTAQNETVQVAARLRAAERRIAALEAKLNCEDKPDEHVALPNGHAKDSHVDGQGASPT